MTLSIIIPVLNEAESLVELHSQIIRVASEQTIELEVIFVDDGSRDGSWQEIERLARFDPRVRGLRFRRNFGKAAALTAGMSCASGDSICMLDADLQDDPAEIPRFIAKLKEGFDVVNGWKTKRLDPWHKVYPSKVFNWLVGKLTGLKLHDHNCGMKLFKVEVAREIRIYGELHRFIPVLANARGFRVTEIGIQHRARQHEEAAHRVGNRARQHGLRRPDAPVQHMLGAIGLVGFGLGFLGLTYLAGVWLLMHVIPVWPPEPIGNRPMLAYSIASTLLGAQAISLGLLAELIVHYSSRTTDSYSIAEETTRA